MRILNLMHTEREKAGVVVQTCNYNYNHLLICIYKYIYIYVVPLIERFIRSGV